MAIPSQLRFVLGICGSFELKIAGVQHLLYLGGYDPSYVSPLGYFALYKS